MLQVFNRDRDHSDLGYTDDPLSVRHARPSRRHKDDPSVVRGAIRLRQCACIQGESMLNCDPLQPLWHAFESCDVWLANIVSVHAFTEAVCSAILFILCDQGSNDLWSTVCACTYTSRGSVLAWPVLF